MINYPFRAEQVFGSLQNVFDFLGNHLVALKCQVMNCFYHDCFLLIMFPFQLQMCDQQNIFKVYSILLYEQATQIIGYTHVSLLLFVGPCQFSNFEQFINSKNLIA